MPIKTTFITEERIRSAELPQHGETYTVIPHGSIIDEITKQLTEAGFSIDKSFYKASHDVQIATGVYHLHYSIDPELSMMFAWSNSYNKQLRFRCAVGAVVRSSGNIVIDGDLGSYSRKHTGNAMEEVVESIREQISNAEELYRKMIWVKSELENTTISLERVAEIVGVLYMSEEAINLSQVAIVNNLTRKATTPVGDRSYNGWDIYNNMLSALKDSHPVSFMEDHAKAHRVLVAEARRGLDMSIKPKGKFAQSVPISTVVSDVPSVILM